MFFRNRFLEAPLTILVTIFAILLFNYDANAAAASRIPREYAPETARNSVHASCCVIPTCDEFGRCYETLSCGHVCSQGNYRPANAGATRGYKKKPYYSKYSCNFGECKEYRFLCTHCPDPDLPEFSYYTLRDDCRNCYDKPQY